jgi:anti-sigma factor RsiW
VAAYLDRHPDVARHIIGFRSQREALRAALAPIAEEPLPPELDLARLIDVQRRPVRRPWRNVVAAVVLLALGGGGGWALRGATEPAQSGLAALAQEAADSYSVFAPDHVRPVEFRATDQDQLVSWVSGRLQRTVTVPNLATSGYRFMGGRLVATAHGPAGLFLYDDDRGTRIAMLVRPMTVDRTAPMTRHSYGPIEGYAWANKGVGYTLVAAASPDVLHPLANEVRRQIDAVE